MCMDPKTGKSLKQMQVSISLSMPTPEQSKVHARPGILDKIEECLTMIESGHDSTRHWDYIRRLNDCLMKKQNITPKQAKILKMIQPAIKKYGRVAGAEQDTGRLAEIGALVVPSMEVDQHRKEK